VQKEASLAEKQRVIAYVDGFNLYFGLRESGLRRCYWLDLRALAEGLLLPAQVPVGTKYFTARIAGGRSGDTPDRRRLADQKRKRQSDFLEALETVADFQMFEGHYLGKDMRCRSCGASWRTHEEKMTDVQIATEMLVDAYADLFDTALLLSADSDLVPPTQAIRRRFPHKRIVACFPPGRNSVQLQKAANASLTIPVDKLDAAQFPDEVTKPDGFILRRPAHWR
jgi:uncharacterized LabA/DUF88 family protein